MVSYVGTAGDRKYGTSEVFWITLFSASGLDI
jgi:hypothetical protein